MVTIKKRKRAEGSHTVFLKASGRELGIIPLENFTYSSPPLELDLSPQFGLALKLMEKGGSPWRFFAALMDL